MANYQTLDYLPDLTPSEMTGAGSLTFGPLQTAAPPWDREALVVGAEPNALLHALYRFSAVEGWTYQFISSSFFDPFLLRLYDNLGNTIVANDEADDLNYGFDVIRNWVAPYTGSFYVDASWDQGLAAGNRGYALSVVEDAGTSNSAPLGQGDTYIVGEDASLIVSRPTGVIANDFDADGDPLTATVVAYVTHGFLAFSADGSFAYMPSTNFNGIDTFTYRLSDGKTLSSNPIIVTITVNPVNDDPSANNDQAFYSFGTPKTIAVLANDSDVDGDALSVTSVGSAAHGTAVLNGNGTVTYTPDAGYRGADSFTYTISDGHGLSDTATVFLSLLQPPSVAQTVMPVGGTYGVLGFQGFPTNVFITGTSAGAEVITIGDYTTAGFSNNFANGGDTIRLTGRASDFTIAVSGNQVSLINGTDQISVNLPVGFATTTIMFETAPNVFADSRALRFLPDGGDADSLPDLFLGSQRVMPDALPLNVATFA